MSKTIKPAGILGLGMHVPERVLTNRELEKMVDTSDEWIRTRTGIKERRVAEENVPTSVLGELAGKNALNSAGIKPEEVDLIIVATISPDMIFPATACLIQDRLGAASAAAFDLEAGCTGFIYGLAAASQFVATGLYNYVLVIGAEAMSKVIDWQDRNTCVVFGDGAGAAVVGPVPEGYGILGIDLGSDGKGGNLLEIPAGGSLMPASEQTVADRLHFVHMHGNEVFRFAVRVMGESAVRAVESSGLKKEDVDFLIPHQANVRIIQSAMKRLELDESRTYINLERYGNTSSASVPIALYEAMQEGRIQSGENVVLVAFGAGLTWGSVVIRFDKV